MRDIQRPVFASRIRRAGVACGLFVLTLGRSTLAFSGEEKDKSQQCKSVSGSISANIVQNPNVSTGLALGTVTGDLQGSTMATFTTSERDGNIDLTLHHNFASDARDTLSTSDTGVLIPVPGLTGIYRMSVHYEITGGAGKFANASGFLNNHGEAGLVNGLLTLTYSGMVCISPSM